MLSLLVFGAATVPTASSRPLTVAPIGRHCTTAQCGFARRTIVGRAALAGTVSLLPLRAIAEFGEGAKQAPPALIPSPFRPTGEIAATCEVVALGREDVCLEPKKLLSSYDNMQLEKARDTTNELATAVTTELKPFVTSAQSLVELVRNTDWALIQEAAGSPPGAVAGPEASDAAKAAAAAFSTSATALGGGRDGGADEDFASAAAS